MLIRVLIALSLAACGGNEITHTPKSPDPQSEDGGLDSGIVDSSVSDPDASDSDGEVPAPEDSGTKVDTDAGKPDSGTKPTPPPPTPVVIIDDTREVIELDDNMQVTTKSRNQCTSTVGEYLIQYKPIQSLCGEIPDEVGDMRKLDATFLSIPKNCTLGHYYSQDALCTITTELVCEVNGCTETRYQDFDWNPALDGLTWLGDGVLKFKRECPNTATCEGTYHAAAFPKPAQ